MAGVVNKSGFKRFEFFDVDIVSIAANISPQVFSIAN